MLSYHAPLGGPLHLASASPRRRELLLQIGVPARVIPCDIDESILAGESPLEYVERVARDKAWAGVGRAPDGAVVLAADTTVVLEDAILGKPADGAPPAQAFYHKFVVHHFVANVNRCAEHIQRAVDDVYSAVYACAKATGIGEFYLHSCHYLVSHGRNNIHNPHSELNVTARQWVVEIHGDSLFIKVADHAGQFIALGIGK